jgi:hypothetical protein
MTSHPEGASNNHRINPSIPPPFGFIPTAVNFAMMPPTQRNRELIAGLAPQRPGLRKSQVMRV